MTIQTRSISPAAPADAVEAVALPRRTRKDRIRSLQLYLAQIHQSNGRWSDGNTVYTGSALTELRDRLVHQLIQARAPSPVFPDAAAWRELAMSLQASSAPQATSLFERLALHLRRAVAGQEKLAEDKARILRRALRRKAQAEFKALPVEVRSTPKESAYLLVGMLNAMMGTGVASAGVKLAYAEMGAVGSILGQLVERSENPFEYTPEEEIRRGLRRAPEMA